MSLDTEAVCWLWAYSMPPGSSHTACSDGSLTLADLITVIQPCRENHSITIVPCRGRLALVVLLLMESGLPPSEGASSPVMMQSSSSDSPSTSGMLSFRLAPRGEVRGELALLLAALFGWEPVEGRNDAIRDSLKLKYPEDSRGVDLTGVKPVLTMELWEFELFPRMGDPRAGELRAGEAHSPLVGVKAPWLCAESLELPRESVELFFNFLRCARGAFVTSCSRNPARCAKWKAFMVAPICCCTWHMEAGFKLNTSGVTRGVCENTVRLEPCNHSDCRSSLIVNRWLGSTVSNPEISFFAVSDTTSQGGPVKWNSPPRMRSMMSAALACRLLPRKGALPDSIVYWNRQHNMH